MNGLLKCTEQLYRECLGIMGKKNADYTQNGHPLKNFMFASLLGVASVKASIFIRLCDKISRLATLIQGEGKVKEETFEDTIKDAINYLAILYYAHQRQKRIDEIIRQVLKEKEESDE